VPVVLPAPSKHGAKLDGSSAANPGRDHSSKLTGTTTVLPPKVQPAHTSAPTATATAAATAASAKSSAAKATVTKPTDSVAAVHTDVQLEIVELRQQLQQSRQREHAVAQQRDDALAQRDIAATQQVTLASERDAAVAERDSAVAKLSAATAALHTATTDLSTAKHTIQQRDKQIAELSSNVDTEQQRAKVLLNKLNAANSTIADRDSTITDLQANVRHLNVTVTAHATAIKKLRAPYSTWDKLAVWCMVAVIALAVYGKGIVDGVAAAYTRAKQLYACNLRIAHIRHDTTRIQRNKYKSLLICARLQLCMAGEITIHHIRDGISADENDAVTTTENNSTDTANSSSSSGDTVYEHCAQAVLLLLFLNLIEPWFVPVHVVLLAGVALLIVQRVIKLVFCWLKKLLCFFTKLSDTLTGSDSRARSYRSSSSDSESDSSSSCSDDCNSDDSSSSVHSDNSEDSNSSNDNSVNSSNDSSNSSSSSSINDDEDMRDDIL
jgi:hypothetical protein